MRCNEQSKAMLVTVQMRHLRARSKFMPRALRNLTARSRFLEQALEVVRQKAKKPEYHQQGAKMNQQKLAW